MKELIDFFSGLKPFIPFGSSILGAVVGGFITYNVFEKKKIREKRLESLFELVAIVQKTAIKAHTVGFDLKEYINKEIVDEKLRDKQKNFVDFMCEDIYDIDVKMPSLAIHINGDIFNEVINCLEEIQEISKKVETDLKYNKDVKKYIEGRIYCLGKIEQRLDKTSTFLKNQSSKYLQKYMSKYIKE